jgi:sarcosine oxidase
MANYDVIVIGTGGVGSAAVAHLARRGFRVLGLDRFPGGHDRGSSHGHTRIIRMAYFEHSDYVPLLRRAYELWYELQKEVSQQLYFPVGLLEVGPPEGIVVPGVLASARQHNLPIEQMDVKELSRRFPGFSIPHGLTAVFEQNAGYLLVEQCVLAHLRMAKRHGAILQTEESVVSWEANGDEVTVRTERGTYSASRLVIAAGPWAGKLLRELGARLHVRRKHLHWFRTANEIYRADRGSPGFFFELPDGYFYGFPQIDDRGVKVAEHSGGKVIEDPLQDDRAVELDERKRVETFLTRCMPHVTTEPTHHTVCYYTMSPDEHFFVDCHPQHPNVCFAAGLSGHGFKFTTVLGEILADLAVEQKSRQQIDFLRLQGRI